MSSIFLWRPSYRQHTFYPNSMEHLDFFVIARIFSYPSSSSLFLQFIDIGCWYLPCKLLPFIYLKSSIFFLKFIFLFQTISYLFDFWCDLQNCFGSFSLDPSQKLCFEPLYLNYFLIVIEFRTLVLFIDFLRKVFASRHIWDCICSDPTRLWDL